MSNPEVETRPTMIVRRDFASKYLNLGGVGLEIGAYDRPLFSAEEKNVRFLDYYGTEELKAFATRDGVQDINIVHVDYIVKEDNFAKHINDRFDFLVASHVVEHIPDIINWFHNIEQVLTPDGRAFLIVPDKRYTFDYIRPLSTAADLRASHAEKRTAPTFNAVFQNIYMFRGVDAGMLWRNEQRPENLPERFDVKTALEIARDYHERQDRSIHSHVFTSETFLNICQELFEEKATNLRVCGFQDTWNPSNEFYVALERGR